ncbi:hypothetical protein FFLO_07023 [Filobasidium floriforme]|uniref:Thioesterase domain-containing protein n=1 Tax=Filobasidium floriforme TaxID=5210 RepID=A0A8K0NPX2_9TREE|nr:hypothetical protein FFLO_07023 [Filobasidium floriforme]
MSVEKKTGACLKAVQEAWNASMTAQGHDWRTLRNLRLIQARPNFLQAKLTIEKEHLNKFKTLHGGVIMSLTDSMASLALTTSGLPPPTGVSVNISTEFLRPGGTEGDELVLESEVLKLGKQLATTRINFYSSESSPHGRKLLAYGSHTKAVKDAWAAAGGKLVKYSEDGETVIG